MKCKSCKREIPDNSIFCNWCGVRQIKDKNTDKLPKAEYRSGKWRIRLTLGGRVHSITAPTEKECIAKAREKKQAYDLGKSSPESLTLGEAVDRYIERRAAVLSPSTIAGYKTMRKNYVGEFERVRVCDFDAQRLVNSLSRRLSPKTVRNAYGFIASVVRDCGGSCDNIRLPQAEIKEKPYLTAEQIPTFLYAIYGKWVELPALLALHGLRRSEILALTWDNIDLYRGVIKIAAAAVPDEKAHLVYKNTTKNNSSNRSVPIMINRLKDVLSDVEDKTGLVVKCYPNTIYANINRICKREGLPEVGVHGLRHSFASLAYHLGLSEKETMAIGGWANDATMHKIYTHLSKADRALAENKMADYYTNLSPSTRRNNDPK